MSKKHSYWWLAVEGAYVWRTPHLVREAWPVHPRPIWVPRAENSIRRVLPIFRGFV